MSALSSTRQQRMAVLSNSHDGRLGMLYHSIIRDKDKATAYLKQGLLLAHSLYPVPVSKSWYQVRFVCRMIVHVCHMHLRSMVELCGCQRRSSGKLAWPHAMRKFEQCVCPCVQASA